MGVMTAFLDALPQPRRRWRITGLVADADLVPDKIPPRAVLLVGAEHHLKWIVFDCPCGSGRIFLNASPSRPRWKIQHRKPLTICPSIDLRHQGHRCHYLVRRGRIRWVRGDRGNDT